MALLQRWFGTVVLLGGLVLALGGCGDDDGGGYIPPPPPPLLKVRCFVQLLATGTDMLVEVSVSHGGLPVDDADVWLNGITVPSSGTGTYSFSGTVAINAGDDVALMVTKDTNIVGAALQMPEKPGIIAPTSAGSPYNAGLPIVVEWSPLSPAPDEIHLFIPDSYTVSGEQWSLSGVDGTATQRSVPRDTFLSGTSVGIGVAAVNRIDSLVGADVGSSMKVLNIGWSGFTTQ